MENQIWLDLETLETLKEIAPEDHSAFLRELITSFLQQSEVDLKNMQEALQREAVIDIGKIAHRMKSVSQQMGAMVVAKKVIEIEQLGFQNSPASDFEQIIPALIKDFEQTKIALNAYMDSGFKNFKIASIT